MRIAAIAYFIIHLLLLAQTLVHRPDKHVRCPEACIRTEEWIIVTSWPSRLHLFQCHTFLDQVLNSVPDDDGHFPEIKKIAEVGKTSVAGNHQRSALLSVNRNDHVNE